MPLFATATLMFPAHGGQDRLAVRQFDDRMILVVADGAGGMRGGAEAAQRACERATEMAAVAPASAAAWVERLMQIDQELMRMAPSGQTTVVVAEVWNGSVVGASVGDSQAWLLHRESEPLHVTQHQVRKPLLGSGAAVPRAFGRVALAGRRLLLATDGLFHYAATEKLLHRARWSVIYRAPSLTLDLVRLPSGDMPDDVAIVVCEEDSDRATRRCRSQARNPVAAARGAGRR